MERLVEEEILNLSLRGKGSFPIRMFTYRGMKFVMIGGHSGIGKSTFFGDEASKTLKDRGVEITLWHMDVKSAGKIFNRPLPIVCVLQIYHRLHLVKEVSTLNFVIGHFEESDVSMAIINSTKDYHISLGKVRGKVIPESWTKVYHKLNIPKYDIAVHGWNWSEWLLHIAKSL